MSEEWRDVPGWSYQVSSLGRVRRVKLLKPDVSEDGYSRIHMYSGNQAKRPLIHRLVAEIFIGPQPCGKPVVAHRDGNPSNNAPSNLYWATPVENAADRKSHGNYPDGEDCPNSRLSNDDAAIIRARHHVGGDSIIYLSKLFSVSRPTIKGIVTGTRYRSAGGYGI